MKFIEAIPQFVDNFSCIADKCENHCCHGWNINIDKPTYKFMVHKSTFKGRSKKWIERIPNQSASSAYARIKLNDQGVCPFRDQQGLCEVHKHHGHACLSDTCKIYPRLTFTRGNRVEQLLSLSCPEAARQILFNPEAMLCREQEIESDFAANSYDRPFYYDVLRQLYIDILLIDSVPMEARLFILGMTLKLLEARKDDRDEFEKCYQVCIEQITNGDFLSTYTQSTTAESFHPGFLIRAFNAQLYIGVKSQYSSVIEQLKKIHNNLLAALEPAGDDIQQQVDILQQGFYSHYSSFIAEYPQLWINYFLYGMHFYDFPKDDWYQAYSNLVIDFVIIRGILMAIASQRELTHQDVIDVVHTFHRARSHGIHLSGSIKNIIENGLQVDEKVLPLMLLKI
ncbi:lysine-N-methylase [Photobacterium damselae subsp. damselae]|uniref:flagellin lysine-N-methylase n=1 Tax=Photobacterium damselae TaxID=38293 RepID=UPI000D077CF8|nr:flagellin lysine-N-methylase [Photobacterium damselae]PSB80191.1 lysine-N-methylase [Photobacterium damselae subsp. damselae]